MTDQELSRDRSRSEPTELITAVTSDSDEDNSNEGRDLFSDTDESDTDDSIPPLPTESVSGSSNDHHDEDDGTGDSGSVGLFCSSSDRREAYQVNSDTPYVLIRETIMDENLEYPNLGLANTQLFFDILQFESGPVAVDSKYVIHFVPEEHIHLPLYDILDLDDSESYRVGYSTLESMPRLAFEKLNREGHLKCTVAYNESTGEFDDFDMGWQDGVDNVVDVLAEMLLEEGDGFALPVYYFLHTYASDHYSSPEAIAEMRGIKPSTVSEKIREAENEIGDL